MGDFSCPSGWMEQWLEVLKMMWGWRLLSTFSPQTPWRMPSSGTKMTASLRSPQVRWILREVKLWGVLASLFEFISLSLCLCLLLVQDVKYIFIPSNLRDYVMLAAAVQDQTVPSGFDKGDQWALSNTSTFIDCILLHHSRAECDSVNSKP